MSTTDAGSAPLHDFVNEAMKNEDKSLVPEQRVHLERLLRKHASAITSGPTFLKCIIYNYNQLDIGVTGPRRQSMRCVPHEHIPVLKTEVDKLQNTSAVVLATTPFESFNDFSQQK